MRMQIELKLKTFCFHWHACASAKGAPTFPAPQFWWRGTSSPGCPGSAAVTASFPTPGGRQTSACQSAWWPRSRRGGPGWAGSPPSPRDLGSVLASRQARPWPQLRERRERVGIIQRATQLDTRRTDWWRHRHMKVFILIAKERKNTKKRWRITPRRGKAGECQKFPSLVVSSMWERMSGE